MCEPTKIDVNDEIVLNGYQEHWKVLSFEYDNPSNPELATKITLEVSLISPEIHTTPIQINIGSHIVLNDHSYHHNVIGFEKKPEDNQIIIYVVFAHPAE